MSKNLMPMPVGGDILQSPSAFSMPYMKYLKAIGDDLLTANKVVNNADTKDFKYTINANICFFTYYTTTPSVTDITIALPYKALLAFDVGGSIYSPGTKNIIILANKNYVQGWYVCDFDNTAKTPII